MVIFIIFTFFLYIEYLLKKKKKIMSQNPSLLDVAKDDSNAHSELATLAVSKTLEKASAILPFFNIYYCKKNGNDLNVSVLDQYNDR